MTKNDFAQLSPEVILNAVETQDFRPTGVLYQLNSYENRVYEVQLEEHEPIIAKFYRPHRWSETQLIDEHRFIAALEEVEIEVVAPMRPLMKIDGYYAAFFPKFRGREHDELTTEDRKLLGHLMARLHNVGATFQTSSRLKLTPQTYGEQSLGLLAKHKVVPEDLWPSIESTIQMALKFIRPQFAYGHEVIAVHGDCHLGNILWNHQGPHLVDFDDMVLAPPVQDIWMLIDEDRDIFFEAYEMFRDFDYSTLRLIEPLRTLRMIRHSAWIGERYNEPIFQKAFPYYREHRYWEEFLLNMKEQISLLQEL